MNIVKSIKGRIDGLRNSRKSRYWEYAAYYADSRLWEDVILFESFGGTNFQGNPYYLYKAILQDPQYGEYRLFVAHRAPGQIAEWLRQQGLMDSRVTVIQKDSPEYRDALAHAKYLVNNVSFSMDYIKKPGQVYLNTWHGTPLKCLGRNIQNDPFECNNAQRNFLLCDYLLAPNTLTKHVYEEDYMVHGIMPGRIMLSGYPRNSVFFDAQKREEVKKKYRMDGVKTVFYMPTWRGTACGVDNVDQVSEIERLAKDLGPGYRVYVKFHPAMKSNGIKFQYCYDMPGDIEVYEFLNAVDILITDYSSVFFDFASTSKQIILYQYDKEQYYKDRGVYAEVAENLPFPVVYDYDALLAAVQSEEPVEYSAFIDRFCSHDSIAAAAKAADLLLNGSKEAAEQPGADLYVIDYPITEEQIMGLKDKLEGTNYRFVFVLKRRAGGFGALHCWNQIDYLVLYMYDRLTVAESVHNALCAIAYTCFRSKKARKVMQAYSRREQRRLWGDLKINHIYAKSKRLPTAIRAFAEEWPRDMR